MDQGGPDPTGMSAVEEEWCVRLRVLRVLRVFSVWGVFGGGREGGGGQGC